MDSIDGCYACAQNALGEDAPPRERIWADEHWRVAHAFGTDVEGWLVLLPPAHIESLAELTVEQAARLGVLLRALSGALRDAVGAEKAYVSFFAEAPEHRHVHVHVIPRMPDQPADRRGPDVFKAIGVPGERAVSQERRDEIALAVRAALARDPSLRSNARGA